MSKANAERGFLDAIYADPDDDVPRLIYADWLDENGQEDRAELIRVQCEAFRLKDDNPKKQQLEQHATVLVERHEQTWHPWLEPFGKNVSTLYSRGLLQKVYLDNVENDDLALLAGVEEIRELQLASWEVTSDGLPHLLALPYLESLVLDCRNVTNDGMRILAQLPGLKAVHGIEVNVNEEGLRHLFQAPALIVCELDDSNISWEAIEEWKKLRMQRSRARSPEEQRQEALFFVRELSGPLESADGACRVDLQDWLIGDEDVEYLSVLPEIEELDLYERSVTDDGLKHLSKLTRLRSLILCMNLFTSLEPLRNLRNLRVLHLNWLGKELTGLTDQGTEALEVLTQLEELELMSVRITERTVKRLAALTQLRVLVLSYSTGIDDSSLKHFQGLSNLERLDLAETNVTVEGAEQLLKHLPKATIVLSGRTLKGAKVLPE